MSFVRTNSFSAQLPYLGGAPNSFSFHPNGGVPFNAPMTYTAPSTFLQQPLSFSSSPFVPPQQSMRHSHTLQPSIFPHGHEAQQQRLSLSEARYCRSQDNIGENNVSTPYLPQVLPTMSDADKGSLSLPSLDEAVRSAQSGILNQGSSFRKDTHVVSPPTMLRTTSILNRTSSFKNPSKNTSSTEVDKTLKRVVSFKADLDDRRKIWQSGQQTALHGYLGEEQQPHQQEQQQVIQQEQEALQQLQQQQLQQQQLRQQMFMQMQRQMQAQSATPLGIEVGVSMPPPPPMLAPNGQTTKAPSFQTDSGGGSSSSVSSLGLVPTNRGKGVKKTKGESQSGASRRTRKASNCKRRRRVKRPSRTPAPLSAFETISPVT